MESRIVTLPDGGERLELSNVTGTVTHSTARETLTSLVVEVEAGSEVEVIIPAALSARAGHRISAVYARPDGKERVLVYVVNADTGTTYTAGSPEDADSLLDIVGRDPMARILAPFRRWQTLSWAVIGPAIGALVALMMANPGRDQALWPYLVAGAVLGMIAAALWFRENVPAAMTGKQLTADLEKLHSAVVNSAREYADAQLKIRAREASRA